MIQLNLLPEIKREYIKARHLEARVISTAVLIMAIVLGLVVAAAVWVYAAQAVHMSLLTKSINTNMSKLKNTKDLDKYITVQNQLANISTLHDNKSITSRLFDVLSRLNPKAPNSVRVMGLTVDTATTTMVFEGETASYTGLETFRDTLKNAELVYTPKDSKTASKESLFKSVTVDAQSLTTSAESGETKVSFKLTATYSPVLFARSSTATEVRVPNIETTQTKQDTPDVFGDSEGGAQ